MTDDERDELTKIMLDMDFRERRLASRRRQAAKRAWKLANPQPPKTWADIRERKPPIAYPRQMLTVGSLRNARRRTESARPEARQENPHSRTSEDENGLERILE